MRGAMLTCASPLLLGHRHLGDNLLHLVVDHSGAPDLALASLLAGAIGCGDLAVGIQLLCRRGRERHKRTVRRRRGCSIAAQCKIELLELAGRQLFGIAPEAVAQGTQQPP